MFPFRPEAAEVGGWAGRLDPRPRRQDAAQEENDVPVQQREQQDVQEEEMTTVAVFAWL